MTRSTGLQARHKVLLVDDDAVSLELMALLLAHEGHQVLRANDAGAALELLSCDNSGRPDVLLVDLQMPGVSGGQLAEKVRALGSPGPLLLAMSASEAQRKQLLAFDGFLLKPFAADDLRRALEPKRRGRPHSVRVAHPGRPAPVADPAQALDMTVVEKLLTMMPLQSLLDLFAACIADTQASVAELRNLVKHGKEDAVHQLAHRIKGAASMWEPPASAGLPPTLKWGVAKKRPPPMFWMIY
jgi:CheY-like chemotaxis protein